MALMSTTSRWGKPFTIADRDAMPDIDGRRYELIGGSIVVTPAPLTGHQRGSRRLERLIEDAAPPGVEVFDAPVDLWLPGDHMVQPDIVVAPYGSVGRERLTTPVLLVVEIVSVGSRTHDRVTKRAVYAEADIEHYWLVDTTVEAPRFTALRLGSGGEYETVLESDDRVETDAPVAVVFSVPELFRPPR